MLFNSLEFLLLFLPVTLGVALTLRGRAFLFWICLASLVFYAFAGHAWFLIPMAITTVLDFLVGRLLSRTTGRRRLALLLLSLSGNLGLLAYFKYSGLIVRTAVSIAGMVGSSATGSSWIALFQTVLPAGISFYTFQTMSYVIDIYRGEAEPEESFFAYLAFVSFFPHLVAGPLTRHNQLIPQLKRAARREARPVWTQGVLLFSIGLCKKVLIADRIGSWIDPTIQNMERLGAVGAWLTLLGYAMQIYFDFSGYSDMAIGLGRLFGVELPQNFNSPYKATSPSDFWKRWHITLSLWLRDYLYISLGGNRCSPRRRTFNLIATMVLGGLWHGANWTFAAWGLYHGLLLVLHHTFEASWSRLSASVQRATTFLLVSFGWVLFRAPSMGVAGQWFSRLLGAHGTGLMDGATAKLAVGVSLALAISFGARNSSEHDLSILRPRWTAALALGTAAAIVLMNYSSKFLYFQF